MSKNRSVLYFSLVALAALAFGFIVSRQFATPAEPLEAGTRLPQPRELAAFSLTDHLGASFTNARLQGEPHLVFFGFTHCPDVCPTTLALLAQLARDPAAHTPATLFVTVDPERDDLLTLHRYVDAFDGHFIGLRGEDAQLEPLLQSLGVVRAIQRTPDGLYTVDHSATLFYLDGQGRLAAVFTPPFSLPKLRADLTRLAAAG
ncbi:MAG: SCO family protein [Steroidobacteraceae bacterium]